MAIDNINQQIHHNSLTTKKRFVPPAYQKLANSMEKQFIEFMLEQMEKTVPGQGNNDSATKFYKSILKSKRAELMSENNGGLGISDIILDKIYPQKRAVPKDIHSYIKNIDPQHLDKENIHDKLKVDQRL